MTFVSTSNGGYMPLDHQSYDLETVDLDTGKNQEEYLPCHPHDVIHRYSNEETETSFSTNTSTSSSSREDSSSSSNSHSAAVTTSSTTFAGANGESSASQSSPLAKDLRKRPAPPPQPGVPHLDMMFDGQNKQALVLRAGEPVDGHLLVDTHSMPGDIQVQYLRLSVYGHVQIHDSPGKPLSVGLFDYERDIRILSTGIRIVRKPQPVFDATRRKSKDKMVIRPADSVVCDDEEDEDEDEDEDDKGDGVGNDTEEGDSLRKKRERETVIDGLVQQLVAQCGQDPPPRPAGPTTFNTRYAKDPTFLNDKTYTLDHGMLHRLRFSLPIESSRPLPGSFDHPHFPIRYYCIALLVYRTAQTGNAMLVSHQVLPVTRFDPSPLPNDPYGLTCSKVRYAWITDSKFDKLLLAMRQRKQRQVMVRSSDSQQKLIGTNERLSSVTTSPKSSASVSSSSPSSWWIRRLLSHISYYCVTRPWQILETPFLSCSLQIPRRVLRPGDPIPLRVMVENNKAHILQVTLTVRLLRKIYLTLSMGELAETTVCYTSTATLTGDEPFHLLGDEDDAGNEGLQDYFVGQEEPSSSPSSGGGGDGGAGLEPFKTATHLIFDLSKGIRVPADSSMGGCYGGTTVLPDMTRGTFQVSYELDLQAHFSLLSPSPASLDQHVQQPQQHQQQNLECVYSPIMHALERTTTITRATTEDDHAKSLAKPAPLALGVKSHTLRPDSVAILVTQ
ncbi:hypothetical protein BCR43DRAFT_506013 [Syncephalastrum racemosum]|uniref:Arrestin C-terminal-like domain-containing protein n=1 Tax=Syncephalastrum racemosum TaxID=13706 RepID=A0A1X2HA38_SYNRA|nr:hypothetical protein BCR43DRAFT_506013 [Syncephalastrum racemosum]